MASTPDDSMTLDSRAPSRSSTPTPSILCQRHMELADDIQRFSIMIQGTKDTLNSKNMETTTRKMPTCSTSKTCCRPTPVITIQR
ncbi:hypothetical protein TNIN_449531 [Trichonephila inaurata madagascariensis]|uniref:Uncharacterized protein n=1 Tax=Trichonephila inaurata madagascariensis TaxID=2747483 RepID=A0A8X6M930_9ARAC|nr:hypothetical protein TNIN_449531 [Trichonephila inaurata madagascariensis]